jgi:3-methyladenine DNA glycosylase Mpg
MQEAEIREGKSTIYKYPDYIHFIMVTKLTSYAFRKDSETVAQEILGNEIVRVFQNKQVIRGYITAVAPHVGKTKASDSGITRKAGTINVGRAKFGHTLVDITTEKEGVPACVTIRGIAFDDDTRVDGPGNVTKALHIDNTLDGLDIDNSYLFITERKDPAYDPSNVRGPLDWKTRPRNCPGYFTY